MALPQKFTELEPQAMFFKITQGLRPLNTSACWSQDCCNVILDKCLYELKEFTIEGQNSEGVYLASCEPITNLLLESNKCVKGENFPYNTFTADREIPCYVSYITDDLSREICAFVQEVSKEEELKLFMAKLNEYFVVSSNRCAPKPAAYKAGSVLAALYNHDGTYYRVLVQEDYSDCCKVAFVDYGGYDKINYENMWVLPDLFQKPDPYSCLVHFEKVKLNSDKTSYEKYCDYLQNNIVNVSVCSSNNFFISITGEVDGVSIESRLVAEGLAAIIRSKPLSNQQKATETTCKLAEAGRKYQNIRVLQNAKIRVVVTHARSIDKLYVRLCKNEQNFKKFKKRLQTCYPINEEDLFPFKMNKASKNSPVAIRRSDTEVNRGVVLTVRSDGKVMVLDVDEGTTNFHDVSELLKPVEGFFELPIQGISCTLLKDANQTSFKGETCFLKTMVNQNFTAEIINSKSAFKFVKLYNDEGEDLFHKIRNDWPLVTLESELSKLKIVRVTNIEDPSHFWVQFKDSGELSALQQKLNSKYEGEDVALLEKVEFGQLCCVKKADKMWARAKVTYHFGNVVEVQLVDSGKQIEVNRRQVKSLLRDFIEVPAFAVLVKLHNLKPADERWSKKAVNDMKCMIEDADAVYVLEMGEDGSAKLVNLYCECETITSLDQTLIESNEAQLIDESLKKQELALPLVPPEAGKIFYTSVPQVLIGKTLRVNKGMVVSPHEFYLKILDLTESFEYVSLSAKLSKKHMLLKQVCNINKDLYIGMPCKILFHGKWFRTALIDFVDLTRCCVCLVDHGTVLYYNVENIYDIENEFVSRLSPAAIRCTLEGLVKPIEGKSWCSGAIHLTEKFLSERSLYSTVRCYGHNVTSVQFVTNINVDNQCLHEYLIEKKVARTSTGISDVLTPLKLLSFDFSIMFDLTSNKNKEHILSISHINEQQCTFYCQLLSNKSTLDALSHDLAEAVRDVRPASPEDGSQICVVRYTDGHWYRGHLLSNVSLSKPSQVSVMLVDYGISFITNSSNLKFGVAEKFINIPVQAVACKLAGLRTKKHNLEEAKKHIIDELKQMKMKQVKAAVVGSDDGHVLLELFNENGKLINQQIRSRYSHADLPSIKETHEGEIATSLSEIPLCDIMKQGESRDVVMYDARSPDQFYVVLDRLKDEFFARLNGVYNTFRQCDYRVEEIVDNDVVCVRVKSEWRRCVVLMGYDEERALVNDLDTGASFEANKKCMKYLLQQYAVTPRFAAACTLKGVSPISGLSWSAEANKLFKENCDHLLKANFQSFDVFCKRWTVSLTKFDGSCCASALVDAGVAVSDDELPSECEVAEIKTVISRPVVNLYKKMRVFIPYVESKEILHLQFYDEQNELSLIGDDINDEEFLKTLKPLTEFSTETCCINLFSADGLYYRARIIKELENGTVLLHYIDYGNTESVEKSTIFQLPQKFMVPDFCVEARLKDAENLFDVPDLMDEYTNIASDESLEIYATFTDCLENNAYSVEMTVLNCFDGVESSLEQFLRIKLDLIAVEKETAKPALDYEKLGRECEKDVEMFSVIKKVVKDKIASEKTLNPINTVSSNEILQETADEVSKIPDKLTMLEIVKNIPVQVYISFVKSEYCFYVQIALLHGNLMELSDEINSPQLKLTTKSEMREGDFCISRYETDGAYYRAKVTKISDDGSVDLQYIDYGNTDTQSDASKIYELPEKFRRACYCLKANVKYEGSQSRPDNLLLEEITKIANDENLQLFATFLTENSEDGCETCFKIRKNEDEMTLDEYLSYKIPLTHAGSHEVSLEDKELVIEENDSSNNSNTNFSSSNSKLSANLNEMTSKLNAFVIKDDEVNDKTIEEPKRTSEILLKGNNEELYNESCEKYESTENSGKNFINKVSNKNVDISEIESLKNSISVVNNDDVTNLKVHAAEKNEDLLEDVVVTDIYKCPELISPRVETSVKSQDIKSISNDEVPESKEQAKTEEIDVKLKSLSESSEVKQKSEKSEIVQKLEVLEQKIEMLEKHSPTNTALYKKYVDITSVIENNKLEFLKKSDVQQCCESFKVGKFSADDFSVVVTTDGNVHSEMARSCKTEAESHPDINVEDVKLELLYLYKHSFKDTCEPNWLRAKVISLKDENKTALVNFIDCGRSIEVNVADLKPIKFNKSLIYKVPLPTRCRLENFTNADKRLDGAMNKVLNSGSFKVQFTGRSSVDNLAYVKLYVNAKAALKLRIEMEKLNPEYRATNDEIESLCEGESPSSENGDSKSEVACQTFLVCTADACTSYDESDVEFNSEELKTSGANEDSKVSEDLNEITSKLNAVAIKDERKINNTLQELKPSSEDNTEELSCEKNESFEEPNANALNKIAKDYTASNEMKSMLNSIYVTNNAMSNDKTEINLHESKESYGVTEVNECLDSKAETKVESDNVHAGQKDEMSLTEEAVKFDKTETELKSFETPEESESSEKAQKPESLKAEQEPESLKENTESSDNTSEVDTKEAEKITEQISPYPSNFNEEDAVDIAGSCDVTPTSSVDGSEAPVSAIQEEDHDDGCLETIKEESEADSDSTFEQNEIKCGAVEENSSYVQMTSAADVICSNLVELNPHEKKILERGDGDARISSKITSGDPGC